MTVFRHNSICFRLGALGLVAGLSGVGSSAHAQAFNDVLVQSPELKAPSRGSVVGTLSGYSIDGSGLARGSFSVPTSFKFPSERGALLVEIAPTYSPEGGQSEWGMGWDVELAITRYRKLGDLDYVTDEFTGPWGPMKLGTDGVWYPQGHASNVRMTYSSGAWIVTDTEGTRYEFSRTIQTPLGTYSWYLTRVTTIYGDQTDLHYVVNSTGRPFLDRVTYGARGGVDAYEVDIDYDLLPTAFPSYASGIRLDLDRRVRSVSVRAKEGSVYATRWTYALTYTNSPLSSSFYLSEVRQTWASGEQEPPMTYSYDFADSTIQTARLEHIPALDNYLQNLAGVASAIQPTDVTNIDVDRDGRIDFEHRFTHATIRQIDNDWTIETLPTPANAHPWCRPAPSLYNQPRTLARLKGSDPEERVVYATYNSGSRSTYLMVCDRPGTPLAGQFAPGDWTLGANTRLADVDRDRRPDIVRVHAGQVTVLKNISDVNGYQFSVQPTQTLAPYVVPHSSWLQDINGDGLVDLVVRHANGLMVWPGRGGLTFESMGHNWTIFHRSGTQISTLQYYGLWFTDANNDGLTDILLSHASGIWLFYNQGDHFREEIVPGLENLPFVQSNPVLSDLDGSGNAQVVYSFVHPTTYKIEAHSVTLNSPSTGLMTAADDGKGTVFAFSYRRSDPVAGRPTRPAILAQVVQSHGSVAKTQSFDYGSPVLDSESEALIGFDRVQKSSGSSQFETWYYHDNDVRNLAIRAETRETSGSVIRFDANTYDARTYLGIPYRRLASTESGWQNATNTVSQTTRYRTYEREFCPVDVELTSPSGVLTTTSRLASVAQLDDVHCLPAEMSASGQHSDAALDFTERQFIARNAYGQVTRVERDGPNGRVAMQTASYNTLHRLTDVFEASGAGTRLTYDPTWGMLQSIESADGVLTTVSQRDAGTDLPTELTTRRGTVEFRQGFGFDGRERLASRWNSFNGTSAASPAETISYGFATQSKPGFVQLRSLLDATAAISSESAELINPDGQVLASLDRIPQGWSVSSFGLHDPQARRTTRWVRSPLTTGPGQLDFATLLSNAGRRVAISTRDESVFGHLLSEEVRFPGGVLGRGTESLSLSGPLAIVESSFEGRVNREGRDASDRVVWKEDGTGARTQFGYDALGRVVSAQLPSGIRHFVRYDAYGRIAEVERDEIGSIEYDYDPQTNLPNGVRVYDKNGVLERTVAHTYDAIGRKTATTLRHADSGRSKQYTYSYDGQNTQVAGQAGHKTGISGPDYSLSTVFNPDSTIASSKEVYGGLWEVRQTHTYFVDREIKETLREVVDLNTNQVIESVRESHRLDAYGRLDEIWLNGQRALDLEYETGGEGHLRAVHFASGGSTQYIYDSDTRQLTGHSTQANGQQSSTSWVFDRRGQIAGELIAANNQSRQRSFAYDDRGFLIAERDSGGVTQGSWAYDSDGLTERIVDQQGTRDLRPTATAAVVTGTVTYVFDNLGRVRQRGADEYIYGPDGEVETARVGPDTYTYAYDDTGRRVLKRKNGSVVAAYVGDSFLSASGMVKPVRVAGRLIGIIQGGHLRPVHTDARGSLVVDENGQTNMANPYGVRGRRSSLMEALDYVEKGYDPALGAVRMGARDYDPMLGRFRTPDPLFLQQVDRCLESPVECNLYSYARNNPLNFTDPTGTISWKQVGSIAKVVGEVGIGFTPAGVVMDVIDLGKAIASGNPVDIAMAGVGFLPGGDIAKVAYKTAKAAKNLKRASNAVEAAGDLKRVAAKVDPPARCGAVCTNNCFAAGTPVRTGRNTERIEKIKVGDRVSTYQGGTTGERRQGWVRLRLRVSDEEDPDHIYNVEMIRQPGWLALRGLNKVGDEFDLVLEEMELRGKAKILEIEPNFVVKTGSGRLVLMTVDHLNKDLYDLRFAGEGGQLRPTGKHPLYSLDRDSWVQVRDLQIGERLQTAKGAVTVEALEKVRGVHRVYNFEVEGDHEYLVGRSAVRAHNTKCSQEVIDEIHDALEPGTIAHKNRTTTLTEYDDGTFALTGSRKPSPAQREVAAKHGVQDVPTHGKQNRLDGEAGHHGEQRGIAYGGNTGRKVVRQVSSSGAKHGGKACKHCAARQAERGIDNPTGKQ